MNEVIAQRLANFQAGKADPISLLFFAIIVAGTLMITYWAAKKNQNHK
ncbi:MAG: hypothetical protein LRY51_06750 [Geovibrio sp.]|nr:hypothetical protein [Geovibrio sp.]